MDVYLMQHGQALSQEQDPARPLSDEGRAAVERVVDRLRAAGVRIDLCLHSGKLRAEQTAEILAAGLRIGRTEARDGLAPNDDVEPVARWLVQDVGPGSCAVVGHLPFLDRLAALLVAGAETAQAVRFRNGGLVKLVPKDDAEGFRVEWAVVPDVA